MATPTSEEFQYARLIAHVAAQLDDIMVLGTPEQQVAARSGIETLRDIAEDLAGDRLGEICDKREMVEEMRLFARRLREAGAPQGEAVSGMRTAARAGKMIATPGEDVRRHLTLNDASRMLMAQAVAGAAQCLDDIRSPTTSQADMRRELLSASAHVEALQGLAAMLAGERIGEIFHADDDSVDLHASNIEHIRRADDEISRGAREVC